MKLFMCAIAAIAILTAHNASALEEGDLVPFTGLICDSAEHVEEMLKAIDGLSEQEQHNAMKKFDDEHGGDVCTHVEDNNLIVVVGKVVKTLHIEGVDVVIRAVLITKTVTRGDPYPIVRELPNEPPAYGLFPSNVDVPTTAAKEGSDI